MTPQGTGKARESGATTKPGKHGTLRLYSVTYRDVTDRANHHSERVWRYSAEHAEDAFYETHGHPSEHDSDGWELVIVRRAGGSSRGMEAPA